jgi:hypothetical protein
MTRRPRCPWNDSVVFSCVGITLVLVLLFFGEALAQSVAWWIRR